jgi:hypothetical protein
LRFFLIAFKRTKPGNETRFGGDTLSTEAKERWMELCEQVSQEQDPRKLMALVAEIDRILEERQDRINQPRAEPDLDPDLDLDHRFWKTD